ncbi:MAG: DUF3467 domain-containing protein [Chloroflexi bacterium]|nr:MAG: DUF3467 domain-containing protein [Chloroflexota bacterium]
MVKTPHPRQTKINIQIPPDLDAVYSNLALITHSASEIIIDFARVLPNTPQAKVYARIITTPLHAKLLLRALNENLEKYETQFGEIKMPNTGDALAQQFFGAVRPPEPPKQ